MSVIDCSQTLGPLARDFQMPSLATRGFAQAGACSPLDYGSRAFRNASKQQCAHRWRPDGGSHAKRASALPSKCSVWRAGGALPCMRPQHLARLPGHSQTASLSVFSSCSSTRTASVYGLSVPLLFDTENNGRSPASHSSLGTPVHESAPPRSFSECLRVRSALASSIERTISPPGLTSVSLVFAAGSIDLSATRRFRGVRVSTRE